MSFLSSATRRVAYCVDTSVLTLISVLIEESTAVNHESAKVLSSVFDNRAYLMRYSK
jgi:hypothetical protein